MGYYVNPPMDKGLWLEQNGVKTAGPCEITESHLPVCLVDNGPFTAAAVGVDAREVQAFQQPGDYRPKQWFRVSREALIKIGAI